MDVDWGPWTVLAEIASRDDPGRSLDGQADSIHPARKRAGAHGHVTQSWLLHPCQALSAQIGMSWGIRMDNLFRAILCDLEHSDRFVGS